MAHPARSQPARFSGVTRCGRRCAHPARSGDLSVVVPQRKGHDGFIASDYEPPNGFTLDSEQAPGEPLYEPPPEFCDTHDCIPNFEYGTGYPSRASTAHGAVQEAGQGRVLGMGALGLNEARPKPSGPILSPYELPVSPSVASFSMKLLLAGLWPLPAASSGGMSAKSLRS